VAVGRSADGFSRPLRECASATVGAGECAWRVWSAAGRRGGEGVLGGARGRGRPGRRCEKGRQRAGPRTRGGHARGRSKIQDHVRQAVRLRPPLCRRRASKSYPAGATLGQNVRPVAPKLIARLGAARSRARRGVGKPTCKGRTVNGGHPRLPWRPLSSPLAAQHGQKASTRPNSDPPKGVGPTPAHVYAGSQRLVRLVHIIRVLSLAQLAPTVLMLEPTRLPPQSVALILRRLLLALGLRHNLHPGADEPRRVGR
jgi:hypothetical protein